MRIQMRIPLSRYSPHELAEILTTRAQHGLRPGSVTTEQLWQIGDEVAGIARCGIQSLRTAAELASERDHDRILDEDLADSYPKEQADIRCANLRSLSFGHHVVYELARLHGEQTGGEIKERYHERAPTLYADRDDDPVGDRQLGNYLTKLDEYDLVTSSGENRWRTSQVVDLDLRAPIDIAPRGSVGT